ncbi:MAG: bifunctional isocitrate dehydrogenase kinase/phosphatase [Thiohalophilus sp.]|uniref:bifunctional isocitrate dehydrogenase kinase/phosphatase n=1 Tax=Thiohalophilus sp. TaxID=3028392 RepID=UPI00286FFB45|nr:bifunctional isocitrate dehydrogenase kinase/phosphatase [Thiohalophilus sp.]MDR9436604.1 bifunctional isocitrate dehydrogenase kinase/phosphatase [Thiohalophilus sp.]
MSVDSGLPSSLPAFSPDPSEQGVVGELATMILAGFSRHFTLFREITREAHDNFVRGDWVASRQAAIRRISLYDDRVRETIQELRERFDQETLHAAPWQQVKFQYMGLLYRHRQPELAETFYNSVFVGLFERHFYNNDFIFVRPSMSTERLDSDDPVYRSFYPLREGWRATLQKILSISDIGLSFGDLRHDVRCITESIRRHTNLPRRLTQHFQIQMLRQPFYRNRSAYLVGRVINGPDRYPFILRIRRNQDGSAYVDRLISERDNVASLFTSARAYFLVDTEIPSAVIRFLLDFLPEKTAADLYTQIGFHKQGKAEFYRDFLDHLQRSSDAIETAPGSKGMVMVVFTLPSYPYVFKLIRDRFPPPKNTTRQKVIDRYHMVKQHDRVGRLSDAWEFSYTAFPVERFTDELLEELQTEAASQVSFEDNQLIIKHLFIERRLEPLNLYLERADEEGTRHALQDYGDAIHDIAAAGIFPGDLLTKNFGITSYGRVIFYDYDEIMPMDECHFRHIPPPRYPEDELAAEPWYSVGPNDIFPEEFAVFLFTDPRQRELFTRLHPELLDADYWQQLQGQLAEGQLPE